MHIPIVSALSAKKRWKQGRPTLVTLDDINQAQKDAPYWVSLVPDMKDFDEEFHLGHAYRLGWVNHKTFWEALFNRFKDRGYGFWVPMFNAVLESGNVPALETFASRYTVDTLLNTIQCDSHAILHPRLISWFQTRTSRITPELTNHVYDLRHVDLFRDFTYDAMRHSAGADSVMHWAQDWSKLPSSWLNEQEMWLFLSYLSGQLNAMGHQPHQKEPTSLPNQFNGYNVQPISMTSTAIQSMVDTVVTHYGLEPSLVRVLIFRMHHDDYANAVLCKLQSYLYHDDTIDTENLRLRVHAMAVPKAVYDYRLKSVITQSHTKEAHTLEVMKSLMYKPGNEIQSQLYALAHPLINPPTAEVQSESTVHMLFES